MSTSLEEIQESIRNAAGTPLAITGRGTWKSIYRHASATRELSFWNYAGVQEYVPGNLTMTVRAGTTLSEITEIAGAENQWFPLDPFGDPAGTIGATIATCSYGPLVTGFGTPRDLVLGVEAVLGTGEIVRGGGRVVKNVAGYDLCRLLTGSWGTIGAISEVTLRLFAKQETEASVAIALPEKRESSVALMRSVRIAPIYPWAMEIVDSRLASAMGIGDTQFLVFRFGGNSNLVKSQIDAVGALGASTSVPADFWNRLTVIPHAWSMRVSGLPTKLFDTWDAAGRMIANAGAGTRAISPERGTARIFFPDDVDTARLFTRLGQFAVSAQSTGLCINVEAMPSVSPLASYAADRSAANGLSAGIKGVFDPHNILNPGFLPQ